ncbi:MAG TPA: glycosyltransferase 87 family protein, partial [Microlunatus sp.]|nr:glycosyltransferase 87 family protein [Microlunatus sp.]
LSEGIGGPMGSRAGRHRWWTPVRVVLALTAVCFAVGMLQKGNCYQDSWQDGTARYSHMCYSDMPYLYTGRGFAELNWPYSDDAQVRARYPVMEYPVGISYWVWGSAWVTHWANGSPDLGPRYEMPTDSLFSNRTVAHEIQLFVMVNALGLAAAALLAAWCLAGVNPRRPWDAALFALSPALALTALVNWDLIAVALVAGALWAWARDRPVLTGVLIGLGTATKLYPLFLLGALLVVCLRRGRLPAFYTAAGAAIAAWLAVNLPAMLGDFGQWKVFWTFNDQRGPDLGSLWLVWQQRGHTVTPGLVNAVSLAFFGAVCLGVLVLGLRARRTPRIPQLALLVVTGFLLVNKVYSPQYVLWLLPLVALARPRWRDVLIWTAGEVFYFGAVWLYLGGWTQSASSGQPDRFYWFAILVRVAVEVYIAVVVVRDILQPWHDPVRADGLTDDPAEPTAVA